MSCTVQWWYGVLFFGKCTLSTWPFTFLEISIEMLKFYLIQDFSFLFPNQLLDSILLKNSLLRQQLELKCQLKTYLTAINKFGEFFQMADVFGPLDIPRDLSKTPNHHIFEGTKLTCNVYFFGKFRVLLYFFMSF